MDKFEKLIKDSVQGYEAPYNPDAWKSLNKKLGPSKGGIAKWIIGSAAVIGLIAVAYNFTKTDVTIENKQQNNIIAKDNSTTTTTQTTDKVQNSVESINDKNTNQTDNPITTNENYTEINATEHSNQEVNNTVENNNFEVEAQPNVDFEDELVEMTTNNTSTTIETNNKPNFKAGIIAKTTKHCLGESFTFTPTVPKQKVIYEWDLGDGNIKYGGVINHNYTSAGTYTVQLTLKDKKTKAIVKKSESIDVTVLSVPQSTFVYEESNGIVPQTNFRNETKQVSSVQWEIVGLYSSNRPEFNYSFKHKGDYVVNLTTTAENGCSSTATKVITIEKDYNLLAPTAFSPNGDFLNDEFIPKALPLLNLPFTMTIYDRQGKMVYQTTDANQPWDGLYTQDGIPAPNGVYIWVVQLTNENGEVEMYQDQVTIAR